MGELKTKIKKVFDKELQSVDTERQAKQNEIERQFKTLQKLS